MEENRKPPTEKTVKKGIKIAFHVALWCITLTVASIIGVQSATKWNAQLVDETKKNPSISYASDSGSSIVFDSSEESVNSGESTPSQSGSTGESPLENTVYVSKSGSKYHYAGCQYVNDNMEVVDLNDALAKGYEACKRCGNR